MNVTSGIVVAVVDDSTTCTYPTSFAQIEVSIDMPAISTSLGRRIEAIDQMNNLAFDTRHIAQDAHELGACKVANFASPQALHPLHGEVFKKQAVVSFGQLMRQLEKPIAATINDTLVDARDNPAGFLPTPRELYLAGKVLLGLFECGHCLAIVQRRFNRLAVRRSEESLQSKIKTRAVTRRGLVALVDFFLYYKVEPKIVECIALDCYRFDAKRNVAALAVLVDSALNVDTIATEQFPTRLLERERGVLLNLLKGWRCGLNLALEIAKEQLVGAVNALGYVLDGLRTHKIPVGIARQFLELGQVFHQVVLIQALAKKTIVATVQGDTVVIDQTRNINLPIEMLILFRAI